MKKGENKRDPSTTSPKNSKFGCSRAATWVHRYSFNHQSYHLYIPALLIDLSQIYPSLVQPCSLSFHPLVRWSLPAKHAQKDGKMIILSILTASPSVPPILSRYLWTWKSNPHLFVHQSFLSLIRLNLPRFLQPLQIRISYTPQAD